MVLSVIWLAAGGCYVTAFVIMSSFGRVWAPGREDLLLFLLWLTMVVLLGLMRFVFKLVVKLLGPSTPAP
jgi:hypothetical protein